MKLAKNLKDSLRSLIAKAISRIPFIPKNKGKKETYKYIEYIDLPIGTFVGRYQYPAVSTYSDLYGIVLIPVFVDYYGYATYLLVATDQDLDKLIRRV